MRLLPQSSLDSYLRVLRKNAIPHVMRRVNRSWTVESKLGKNRYGSRNMTNAGMNFVRQVSLYVKKNNIADLIPKKDRSELGLKYMMFDKKRRDKTINDAIEIDLTMAYWKTAYRLKVISKELFKKGEKMDKIDRLASLGALAKKVYEREFDGKSYSKTRIIKDSADTRHIWYAISNEVDKVMQEAMAAVGDKFIFYWVDAIFFEGDEATKHLVKNIFKKNGYRSTTVKIKQIVFGKDSVKVYKTTTENKKGKAIKFREFCYSVLNETYWTVEQYKARVYAYFNATGGLEPNVDFFNEKE